MGNAATAMQEVPRLVRVANEALATGNGDAQRQAASAISDFLANHGEDLDGGGYASTVDELGALSDRLTTKQKDDVGGKSPLAAAAESLFHDATHPVDLISETYFDPIINKVKALPTWAKVTGAVFAGIVGIGVIGYTVRAFR